MIIKKIRFEFFLPVLLYILVLTPSAVDAGTAAVYPSYSGDNVINHILSRTEHKINELFSISGLYYPADYHRKKTSLEKASEQNRDSFYKNAAQLINADLAVFLDLKYERGIFRLLIKAVSFTSDGEKVLLNGSVRSSIPENIPLKAALKCAELLKTIKLEAEVTDLNEDGLAFIDAGQWNGLETGRYKTSIGTVDVRPFGRYFSYAEGVKLLPGDRIVFDIYPDLDDYIEETEKAVIGNIVKKPNNLNENKIY